MVATSDERVGERVRTLQGDYATVKRFSENGKPMLHYITGSFKGGTYEHTNELQVVPLV